MDVAWVDTILELWKKDDDIDFYTLEKAYQLRTFERRGIELGTTGGGERESLLICQTGFAEQRDEIADWIVSNGGRYTGDLTRKCTHLIVNKPEGKKFTAARIWGIKAVTLQWLTDSIQRGMILEETRFDPELPSEEQGAGAWIKKDAPRRQSLGKRARSEVLPGPDEGTRKLKRTATMKLNSQRDNIWGDILGRPASREYSFAHEDKEPQQKPQPQPGFSGREEIARKEDVARQPTVTENQGIFGACVFCIHGFNQKKTTVLSETVSSLGGRIAASLDDATNNTAFSSLKNRFLIVPQISQPDSHPKTPSDDFHVVTEFYIENCLHNRQFFFPNDQTLGRPFPSFPIPGFSDLTVCSAAFTGIELSQVARAITQLGAKFEEQFRRSTSVLVCKSLDAIRKEKLRLALGWGVPVVSADWLWECISTGCLVPFDDFVFSELKSSRYQGLTQPTAKATEADLPGKRSLQRTRSEPVVRSTTHGKREPAIDTSAFDQDSGDQAPPQSKTKKTIIPEESTISADFMTAPSRPLIGTEPPLTELSSASLNKSPSPPKSTKPAPRAKSDPSHSKTAPEQTERQDDGENARDNENKDAAEAERRAAKALERETLTSKITSLLDTTAHNPHTPQDAGPRPRKRQILGRAISNASSAADNNNSAAAAPLSAGSGLDGGENDGEEGQQGREPPSTQIGYYDPEAQERKAELLSRMMGGSGEPSKHPGGAPAAAAKSTNRVSATAAGTRTLRRR